jgi:hypothetical protein
LSRAYVDVVGDVFIVVFPKESFSLLLWESFSILLSLVSFYSIESCSLSFFTGVVFFVVEIVFDFFCQWFRFFCLSRAHVHVAAVVIVVEVVPMSV